MTRKKEVQIPDDLLYTKTHEWIKLNNGNVKVGITDHAQRELTDIVYVELPKLERSVKIGEKICSVESIKTAADIYAPCSGIVIEVNKQLETAPELVNKEPYGNGWLFVLKISNEKELETLLHPDEYKKLING